MLLAKEAEPAQEMRIPAQLGRFAQVGKSSVEISKKIASASAILFDGLQLEGSGQHLDLGFEELIEGGLRLRHDILSGVHTRAKRLLGQSVRRAWWSEYRRVPLNASRRARTCPRAPCQFQRYDAYSACGIGVTILRPGLLPSNFVFAFFPTELSTSSRNSSAPFAVLRGKGAQL